MLTMPQVGYQRINDNQLSNDRMDMAKKSKPKKPVATPVTPERAARLCKLMRLLAAKPQARENLTTKLKLGIRGFYRDLEALREADIKVNLDNGGYSLHGKFADVVTRLPFPDPGLNLGEATQLARGRTEAHRKLKKMVDGVMKG